MTVIVIIEFSVCHADIEFLSVSFYCVGKIFFSHLFDPFESGSCESTFGSLYIKLVSLPLKFISLWGQIITS